MMNQEILLSAENLKKYFAVRKSSFSPKQYVKAVDGVTFDILKGETFGLVGESGCGKSTLGRTLIRMYEPTDGKLIYDGVDISHATSNQMSQFRNKMQIIFQDPYSALNPYWNVEEILKEPLQQLNLSAAEKKEKIEYLLQKVGMKPEDMGKFPYEFSGGQRQRIGIARALTVDPEFIMCDEPISALDVSIQAQVVNMLEDLQSEMGLTYLFAAHDLSMVRYISSRIGVMYLGNLVEIGKSDTLYTHPLHPYTKALLSAVPIADPKSARKKIYEGLHGEPPNPMDKPKGCPFAPRCKSATEICKNLNPALTQISSDHIVACHNI